MRRGRGALGVLAALLLVAPAVPAGPPLPLPWVVTEDVTYEGVPLLVTADVTVAPGGTLRLRGVAALVVGAPAHVPRITVQDGGTLELQDGASAVNGATQPTTLGVLGAAFDLVVEPGGTLRAGNASLRGVRIELRSDDATFEASHLNLSAGPLRVTGGSPVLRGGVLEGSPTSLVQVEAGALRLEGTTLRDAGGNAAVVTGGALLHLVGAEVRKASGYSVAVDGAALIVEGTTFADSSEYALHAVAASVVLRGNTFATHCGAYLLYGSAGTIEDNMFDATGHGLSLGSTGAFRIAGNTFRGSQEGLFVSDTVAEVAGNQFLDNVRGAVLRGAEASVWGNLFEGNSGGLEVEEVVGPPPVAIAGNAFGGNHDFALQNHLAEPVDARGNWWGGSGGPGAPGADAVLGPALVQPWLDAPPGQ